MTEFIELRNADYRRVLATQRALFADMVEQRGAGADVDKEYLFLVEHNPVYTLGKHGDKHNLTHAEFLRAQGLDLVEIERGGDITYHGPGQVVAYPLIDMARRSLGVKGYVNLLEEAVIRTIAEYGIRGERVDGATGVWIDVGTPRERKICAIGIKCSRFITMHGLALNVCTDLSYFNAINPCGFIDKGVTSIAAELARTHSTAPAYNPTAGLPAASAGNLDNTVVGNAKNTVVSCLDTTLVGNAKNTVVSCLDTTLAGNAKNTVVSCLDNTVVGLPAADTEVSWDDAAHRLRAHLTALLAL